MGAVIGIVIFIFALSLIFRIIGFVWRIFWYCVGALLTLAFFIFIGWVIITFIISVICFVISLF